MRLIYNTLKTKNYKYAHEVKYLVTCVTVSSIIIVATDYYEWQKQAKEPYYETKRKNRRLICVKNKR